MFYSPCIRILGFLFKETILRTFKVEDSRRRIHDGGYLINKDVLVTSLLLRMTANPLSGTIILANVLLLRVFGHVFNCDESNGYIPFQPKNLTNYAINEVEY